MWLGKVLVVGKAAMSTLHHQITGSGDLVGDLTRTEIKCHVQTKSFHNQKVYATSFADCALASSCVSASRAPQ